VVAPAPFGGLETVLRALAAGHAGLGHTVRVAAVLSPGGEPHPFVESLRGVGIATDTIRVSARRYFAERAAIRELCKSQQPDVVHTHGYRPDFIDGGVARSEKVPVVSTCHGFIESGTRARIYHWLQRRALRSFDAIVAVSSPIEKNLRDAGIPPEKISLVPNAYQPTATPFSRESARRELGLPDATLIGWVGRLSFEKGLDVAIEALAQLQRSDAYLVVIGEGQEKSALRNLAQRLGLADRVLWRGAIPNAERLFHAFDAFLLSSRTEGTPMALLEAMAANVPIVATEVGGVPDVIDSSSARLVRAGDAAGIAVALEATLSEPDRTAVRIQRARERLRQQFDVASWLSRYESIYRSVARA